MVRPRRQRQRQPSFSEDNPEFFKVFLPNTCSHEISIPQAFIKYFNGTIPKRAILKDQTGKSWRVGLEQTNRRLCFNSGWHCFASDHSLEFGDFLIFKFNRSSLFEVKIFSKTGCKKEQAAPIGKPIPFVNLEEDSKTELTCSRPTRFGKRKRSEVGLKKIEAGGSSEASRHKLKRTTGTNLTKTPHFDRMYYGKPKQLIREDCTSSRASLALEAARKFISENPFIKVLITSARLKCAHMDVPSGFIKKYKRGTTRTVMLQVANRSWPVKLLVYPRASYKLSAGWSAFMKENTLKEGDVCIFELIKRDDIVFKVNIFRGIN
ncbi:hypothetical protein ACB094_02G169700 [Castanea mollissima]